MTKVSTAQFPNITLTLGAECFDYVRVFSSGSWMLPRSTSILQHALFRFNVQMILYISIGHFFHYYLRRFHIPKVSSDILAGLVLGPCCFEKYFPYAAGLLFNSVDEVIHSPNNAMASLGRVGFVIFIFLAGVRMDPGLLRRMGREPILLGVVLSIVPVVFSISLNMRFLMTFPTFLTLWRVKFMALYFRIAINCHFIGVVHILMQEKILNSRVGQIALTSQLVTELISFANACLTTFSVRWQLLERRAAFFCIILTFLFTVVIVFGLPPVANYFIRLTPEGKPVKKFYINVLVIIMFASAYAAESVGTFFFFGPFLCGLMVPSGTPVARDLICKMESFVSGTILSLMVTFTASKFDFDKFIEFPPVIFYISFVAIFIKMFVTFLLALACCKLSVREATALSLVLHSKGILEMGMFLCFGSIESRDTSSTSGILFVLIFSVTIPPLIRLLYDPARQYVGFNTKSIRLSPPDENLSILACAHRQEDVVAAVKVLGYIPSTKQSRVCIYGLCLEELVASFTPVLINHQLNQKFHSIYGSRSQSSLETFNFFRNQNKSHQVSVFTAVSHVAHMYEDICLLAFSHGASMIIMPFHKKWNRKTRKLVPGSNDLRMISVEVLNRAPCSTAILVDRHSGQGLSTLVVQGADYRVCLLFVTGNDDREALALATRMMGSDKIKLTVVRLILRGEEHMDDWEAMLDTEAFRNFREQISESGITVCFKEETVDNGIAVASLLQELQSHYDLIIVGRRHNPNFTTLSQLSEWTELPELGPIGDILAAEDIKDSVSVLIVQHQNTQVQNNNLTSTLGGV